MKRIGLTGGIASGKSWVALQLREFNFRVLDADLLGHQLIEPGATAYDDVVREFGKEILRQDSSIDRKKLGAIAFADPKKLVKLNAILHPRIEEAMNAQFEKWRAEGNTDPVFVEAALLVEAGMHKRLDGLVVVWCRPEDQVTRLLSRGLSEEEARRRIALQMPNEEKLKFATYKIDTSGTMQYTQEQVAALAKSLRAAET
ncbi:MAG: dephospho-CoA kinase [Acidobacteria bacterium]|nr:dephospho-CoA kinase [Acidobacteriota bacterium]MBS1865764.1 dephospho-CoA kinase [Acidobacteriota bacterium]